MEYGLFKECILEAMKERFGENCNIEYREVLKNNGIRLDGLVVRFDESGISPTVYVNDYHQMYEEGESLDSICDRIEGIIRGNSLEKDFDANSLIDFDKVKDNIVFKLINYGKNTDLLKDIPHKQFLDLAIVYYISIDEKVLESATILINNTHLMMWEKDAEEIDALARKNAPRLLKAELKSMAETLSEMLGFEDEYQFDDDECNMYVLSNEKKHFGASVILYENMMKEICKKLEGNVYILPSSVHETILIPSRMVDTVSRLDEMVCEVNETQVPTVDILSDHSYLYNMEKECFEY